MQHCKNYTRCSNLQKLLTKCSILSSYLELIYLAASFLYTVALWSGILLSFPSLFSADSSA